LATRQINPQISIEGRCRDTLQDGGAHAGYLKPNFFLSERVNKPCERR
jgi:hypothetical protein